MAFLAGVLADLSGRAQGREQSYRDAVADQAQAQSFALQQKEFEEQQREFNMQQGLDAQGNPRKITLPKSLSQVAPGNKGKPATPDQQAQHYEDLASYFTMHPELDPGGFLAKQYTTLAAMIPRSTEQFANAQLTTQGKLPYAQAQAREADARAYYYKTAWPKVEMAKVRASLQAASGHDAAKIQAAETSAQARLQGASLSADAQMEGRLLAGYFMLQGRSQDNAVRMAIAAAQQADAYASKAVTLGEAPPETPYGELQSQQGGMPSLSIQMPSISVGGGGDNGLSGLLSLVLMNDPRFAKYFQKQKATSAGGGGNAGGGPPVFSPGEPQPPPGANPGYVSTLRSYTPKKLQQTLSDAAGVAELSSSNLLAYAEQLLAYRTGKKAPASPLIPGTNPVSVP